MSKLPMDLSKFKKVASDKHTSTFRHYAGHEIKIAHNKLSSKLRDQLGKLPIQKTKTQKFDDGGVTKPTELDEMTSALNPFQGDSAMMQSDHDAAMASLPTTPDDQATPDQAPTAPDVPPMAAAPSADMAMSDQSSPDPYGSMGAIQQQIAGAQKVGAGQQAEAQAVGAQGAQNAAQEQAFQQQTATGLNAYHNARQNLVDESAKTKADIAAGHIDPNKYLKSMSTGGKIATGIGLIFGGMGAGLTHGPDLAFKGLQDNIERDIQSQRDELGKKQSLLSHNLQQTRDLDEAYGRTRMQTNDILGSHLRMTADQSADPIAKARMMQIAGMTDQSTAQLQHQMAMAKMQQAVMGGGQGGQGMNPVMAIKLLAPPAQQPALMKDLKTKQDTDGNIQNMLGAFDRVAGKNTILNKANPQAQSQIDADWDPKMVKLAHESAGRFNLEELPIMNKYKPNALDTSSTIAQKRQDFLSDMTSRAHFPSLEPYGVRASMPQAAPQMQTMGGKKYQKVAGGWKLVQ